MCFTGWGKKITPLRKSQIFCHLFLFRSEILQACRGERLTYSDQVLCEKVQAVQKLLSFYEKWSKIEINIAGNDDYSMFHEKLVSSDVTKTFFQDRDQDQDIDSRDR